MQEKKNCYQTVDEYIDLFPEEVQQKLQGLRNVIRNALPEEAQETISWQMPTFVYHGNLVHFAAHKKHIGFYPGANGMELFREQLADYVTSKGAVQFPFEKQIPYEIIEEIVKFRVLENRNLEELRLVKKVEKKKVEKKR